MKTIVIDACALIAYIKREKGASLVETVFRNTENSLVIHAVNFYEVYYDLLRNGHLSADFLYELVKRLNIRVYEGLEHRIVSEGAKLKICYSMSLADSIACGLTLKLDAALLTADRHEFAEIAREKLVKIKFIR